MFVFLRGNDLEWQWWSVREIRDYIREVGLDDEELLEGLKDFDCGGEFLGFVIESVDGSKKQEAHFHRMSKMRMNGPMVDHLGSGK